MGSPARLDVEGGGLLALQLDGEALGVGGGQGGAAFDEKTGLVGFRSNRAYAADGQCGGILKAYREHLMSPDDFRAAFTAAEGWGLFSQKRDGNAQTNRIEVRWGKVRLRTLAFAVPEALKAPAVKVAVAGKPVKAAAQVSDARLELTLADEAVISAGEALELVISAQ